MARRSIHAAIPLSDDDLTHQVTVLLGRSAPEARDAVGSRAFDHR